MVAFDCAEPSTRALRSPTQRKLGSSWNPTHMRSAATAVGAARPASTDRTMTRRTIRLTKVSQEGGEDGGLKTTAP